MRAKEMCRSCPVIAQCRSHALAVAEPYGIWGGLSESERELLLKRGIRRTACSSSNLDRVPPPAWWASFSLRAGRQPFLERGRGDAGAVAGK
jgi:hypothetical protein